MSLAKKKTAEDAKLQRRSFSSCIIIIIIIIMYINILIIAFERHPARDIWSAAVGDGNRECKKLVLT